jgi:hypothetical protein
VVYGASPYYEPFYDTYGYSYEEPYSYPGYTYAEPSADGDAIAECMRRFKSYDVRTMTYLGYDGLRHPCP